MMEDKVPATLRATRMMSAPDITPSSAPPGTAMTRRGSSTFHALPGDTAALTAKPNAPARPHGVIQQALALQDRQGTARQVEFPQHRRRRCGIGRRDDGAERHPQRQGQSRERPAGPGDGRRRQQHQHHRERGEGQPDAQHLSRRHVEGGVHDGRSHEQGQGAGAVSMLKCGAKGNAATQPPASASMAG